MTNTSASEKLPRETRHRLERLARSRDASVSDLVTEAVERYLDTEEIQETERQITAERWARYETTGETISHEAVAERIANLRDRPETGTGRSA